MIEKYVCEINKIFTDWGEKINKILRLLKNRSIFKRKYPTLFFQKLEPGLPQTWEERQDRPCHFPRSRPAQRSSTFRKLLYRLGISNVRATKYKISALEDIKMQPMISKVKATKHSGCKIYVHNVCTPQTKLWRLSHCRRCCFVDNFQRLLLPG